MKNSEVIQMATHSLHMIRTILMSKSVESDDYSIEETFGKVINIVDNAIIESANAYTRLKGLENE